MNSSFLYILITIIGTVLGQLMVKSGVLQVGQMPSDLKAYIPFFFKALINIRIIFGFLLAFLAALAWIAAMTKLQLSVAYPFMSLSFVLVLLLGAICFQEPITALKTVGMILVVLGIIIGSQG
jgi:multidrug transporter EmrE-like cation transporter